MRLSFLSPTVINIGDPGCDRIVIDLAGIIWWTCHDACPLGLDRPHDMSLSFLAMPPGELRDPARRYSSEDSCESSDAVTIPRQATWSEDVGCRMQGGNCSRDKELRREMDEAIYNFHSMFVCSLDRETFCETEGSLGFAHGDFVPNRIAMGCSLEHGEQSDIACLTTFGPRETRPSREVKALQIARTSR